MAVKRTQAGSQGTDSRIATLSKSRIYLASGVTGALHSIPQGSVAVQWGVVPNLGASTTIDYRESPGLEALLFDTFGSHLR